MFFPLISTGAINSLLFGIYGNHLRQLRKVCHSDYQREQLEYHNMFMAGSVAGFIQSFIACPMELIKVRLQTASCEFGIDLAIQKLELMLETPPQITMTICMVSGGRPSAPSKGFSRLTASPVSIAVCCP